MIKKINGYPEFIECFELKPQRKKLEDYKEDDKLEAKRKMMNTRRD